MIGEILMLFIYLPGFAELCVLLISFLVLRKKRPGPKLITLSRAVLATSIIGLTIWSALSVANDGNSLLKPLQYTLTGGWALVVLKINRTVFHRLSFPVAALIFGVFTWQFTFVHEKIVMSGTWEEEKENGYEPGAVTMYVGCHGTGMVSPELLSYLKNSGKEKFELTYYPMYHYGKLAGYNLDRIDGKKFPEKRGWSTSRNNCTHSQFPEYHFGVRGLTLSSMYEGWTP